MFARRILFDRKGASARVAGYASDNRDPVAADDAEVFGHQGRDRADVGQIEKREQSDFAVWNRRERDWVEGAGAQPGRCEFNSLARRRAVTRVESGRVVKLRRVSVIPYSLITRWVAMPSLHVASSATWAASSGTAWPFAPPVSIRRESSSNTSVIRSVSIAANKVANEAVVPRIDTGVARSVFSRKNWIAATASTACGVAAHIATPLPNSSEHQLIIWRERGFAHPIRRRMKREHCRAGAVGKEHPPQMVQGRSAIDLGTWHEMTAAFALADSGAAGEKHP